MNNRIIQIWGSTQAHKAIHKVDDRGGHSPTIGCHDSGLPYIVERWDETDIQMLLPGVDGLAPHRERTESVSLGGASPTLMTGCEKDIKVLVYEEVETDKHHR